MTGGRVIVSDASLALPTVQDERTGTSMVREKRVRNRKSKVIVASKSNNDNEPLIAKQQASFSPQLLGIKVSIVG